MPKRLYIVASRFENITGGLIWTNELAEYARNNYPDTIVIDLSKKSPLFENNRFVGMFFYLFYFLSRNNYFIFIDHRLHLRFNLALLANLFLKRGRFATICHHVLYKTKKSHPRRRIERFSEKIFLSVAQRIVVPSQRTAQEVMSLKVKVDGRKIVVINPTHTFRGCSLPKREFRNNLLFVGNLEERKGVDTLLRALGQIANLDYRLDVVGGVKEDRYQRYLKRLSFENRISEKIIFHGRVDAERIITFYKNANIFVFPSRYEGYGMVLLEAMSFGLPIVATAIPTTQEIIEDKLNGYLSPVDDIDRLAQNTRTLLSNRKTQRRMSLVNFKASRKFRSWDDVAKQTFESFAPFLRRKS